MQNFWISNSEFSSISSLITFENFEANLNFQILITKFTFDSLTFDMSSALMSFKANTDNPYKI